MEQSTSLPSRRRTALTLGRFDRGSLLLPISAIALLALWQAYVVVARPASYILPAPVVIANALWHGLTRSPGDASGYWFHLASTLHGSVFGFILGAFTGIVLGILVAEFKPLERTLLPYAVALQSLPKVAIAPLILIWFGFGPTSKIILASLLVFFPLLINTFVGLTLVDRDSLMLMRSLRSNRWVTLWKVKLPAALPMIFAGLDIGTVFAILGAVVAEFIGSDAGIGVMILQAQTKNDTASVFAELVVLGVVGLVFHGIVDQAGKRIVFWARTDDIPQVTS